MKKNKSRILCAILSAALLTGCGSNFSESDQQFRELAREQNLSGTVLTLMASADWVTSSERERGTDFEAATGIQIDYELYPDEVYLDTLFARLDSDNPPDIFLVQSGLAIQNTYHLDRYAVDLSDEPWMEYYDPFSAAETSINGRNYGMTFYDNTIDYYLIYNKKLLQEAGVTEAPGNYRQFILMCDKVAATGVTPIYEPMADGWHQTMLFAESGQVFEIREPGTIERLNNNEVRFAELDSMMLALTQIQELALAGYMGNSFDKDTYDNAIGYLANGQYAMSMLRPGFIDSIVASEMNKGYKKEDFGIMLFPMYDNQYLNVHPTAPSRFISSASPNVEAARLYLQYLATRETVQYIIDHEDGTANLPFTLGQTPKYDDVTQEFLEQFTSETSGFVLQDVVNYFNEQWGEISADILQMCLGKLSPGEVLQNIDARRTELARAAGDPNW